MVLRKESKQNDLSFCLLSFDYALYQIKTLYNILKKLYKLLLFSYKTNYHCINETKNTILSSNI
jgi:hypothetical protein